MDKKDQSKKELKTIVKEKYGQISRQNTGKSNDAGCGCGCSTEEYTVFAEDYSKMEGYNAEADLGLGCGLPTEYAHISEGDTVVDLGSGAGNDCFVARQITGETGKVIGLDMTEEMVDRARRNADKLGFENVEFILGDIEDMPLESGTADVVVSNCVMNLVPDKQKAFDETYRILKAGGHFSISDIVTKGSLPDALKRDAELYAGCVSGAVSLEEYLGTIETSGFVNVNIQKKKEITLPDELLSRYLSDSDLDRFRESEKGIYSVTVYGEKPER